MNTWYWFKKSCFLLLAACLKVRSCVDLTTGKKVWCSFGQEPSIVFAIMLYRCEFIWNTVLKDITFRKSRLKQISWKSVCIPCTSEVLTVKPANQISASPSSCHLCVGYASAGLWMILPFLQFISSSYCKFNQCL